MKKCTLLLLGLFLLALPVWSQVTTGSIAGTVKDSSGAVVPNATVTITNTDTKVVVRTVKSLSGGDFSAPLLPIGHYSVAVEAQGFQKFVQDGIVLNASDKLTVNPTLSVGTANQQVNVQANALQVETQSTQAAGLVTGTQVRELALNGRNWEQLLTLTPGVNDAGNADQLYVGNFAPQGTNLVGFSVNGGRREENNYMLDGADNIDRGGNLTLLSFPSVDSIAEFRVIRGQYDPEYGRAASGQINVITRSGTASLHGNLYEFWRNDALNARPFASLYPVVTPHIPYLRYHDFGGTLGGPVWIPKIYEQKNKTFFFFSEEARRNLTYTNASAVVPTGTMQQGQFAHPVCVAFASPTSNTCSAYGTSIANIDPISQAYITDIFSKFPAPNNGANGYTSTLKGIFNFREEIIKVDHVFSDKFSINGKIARDTIPTQEPGGLFTNIALDGIGTTSTNSPGHNYTLRATWTLSPTLLIEPGYAYSYGAIVSDPIGLLTTTASPDVAAAVKLPFTSQLDRIPDVNLGGGGTGAASFGPYRDYNRNHTVFTNVTYVHGGHTFKGGFTYYHYNKSENAGRFSAGAYAFNFGGVPTSTTNGGTVCGTGALPACPSNYEQSWANFLLGHLNSISSSVPGFQQSSFDLTADILDNQFEWYAQDTWRVRPNITLSYGLRWSFFRQPTDGLGLLSQFDPAAYNPAEAPCVTSTGALDISKDPVTGAITSACNPNFNPLNGYIFTHPPTGGTKSPYGDKIGKEFNRAIAPRIGIAWDPWSNGKTSVRAGFGQFYDPGIIFGNAENNIFLGTGFLQNPQISIAPLGNPTAGTANFSTAAPAIQSRIPINYQSPYTNQWSLDVQRDVAAGWLLDVGYYGNNGIHLPGFNDFNQPAENAYTQCNDTTPCMSGPNLISFGPAGSTVVNGSTTARLNAIRPYVGYAGASGVLNIYTANYNSLQTQLQKQFKGNSLVNISYTWSHSLTTYIADRTIGSIVPLQGHISDNNYGPGVGDRRHVLTANFVWELPWLRKQEGFSGKVLGGWQVSGVQTFQSGLPATVSSNQAIDPTGADCLGPSPCSLRVNQIGDPNSNQPQGFEGWFNADAFANPVAGQTTIPSERPDAVRLPGFWRTDLGLFKNIKFTERFTGQFRAEAFNAFNHLNPICCASFTTSSSLYNKIRSARDPRTMELALKLQF